MHNDDLRRTATRNLLVETTSKLIELRHGPAWAQKLPRRCPPVLWFGDAASEKPKVVTLAANPSRKEYLHDSVEQAQAKVRETGDDTLLSYLESPRNRFRMLDQNEVLSDILSSERLQDEIVSGYDSYFNRNPYTKWFGLPRERSYNVEGFLRGLDASYYGRAEQTYRAIHIDLFPFATLADFGTLRVLADRGLFMTKSASSIVATLLQILDPAAIVIFGRANVQVFGTYIDKSVLRLPGERYGSAHFQWGIGRV